MNCINNCSQSFEAFMLIFSYIAIIFSLGFLIEAIFGGFKE